MVRGVRTDCLPKALVAHGSSCTRVRFTLSLFPTHMTAAIWNEARVILINDVLPTPDGTRLKPTASMNRVRLPDLAP